MVFIQIHKHEARVPYLQPLAIFLWLLVIYELIFNFVQYLDLLLIHSLAGIVTLFAHTGIKADRRYLIFEIIAQDWSFQYLISAVLCNWKLIESYYARLVFSPTILYTALYMAMKLSAE